MYKYVSYPQENHETADNNNTSLSYITLTINTFKRRTISTIELNPGGFRLSGKCFFRTNLGCTKMDFNTGRSISQKPINKTGTDKINLKSDAIAEKFPNGIRHPFSYSYDLDKPAGQKVSDEN